GSHYFSLPEATFAGTVFRRDNTIDDVSAKGDVEWLASRAVELKGGFWAGRLRLRLADEFDGQQTLDSRIESSYANAYAQARLRLADGSDGQQTLDSRIESSYANAYAQARLRPATGWTVTAGLRANYFSSGRFLHLEPRLEVTRAFGERVLAQAAYGRYYQHLTLVSNEAFSGFDVWITADDGVPPAFGDQFVLGLKTRPADAYGFDVEVYYRTLRDLFELDPNLPDVAGLD